MSDKSFLDSMPIEIWLKFFSYLPTKELVRCRAVSNRWKEIIDEIIQCENYWQKKIKVDYANVLGIAQRKCRIGMVWSDLYRSLSLWSKLSEANEEQDEFCPASSVAEEIRGFTILPNGIIGVHKRTCIVYYDVETFKPVNQKPIHGEYLTYTENKDVIVTLSVHLHLQIKRKIKFSQTCSQNAMYDDVKTFLLLDHCVYYINMDDYLHIVSFNDTKLKNQSVCKCPESIMAMGYKEDQLQLLTYQRKVLKLVDQKLIFVQLLGPTSNILHELYKHNLLELLDWRIYVHWTFVLNHNIPPGSLQDIVSTRTYGDMVFVGTNWGVLRIYYQPFIMEEFDFFKAQPIKQYNFMERYDCPVLSMCPILEIDVFEVENGHLVIVAMPKKIAVLSFKHNNLKTLRPILRSPELDISEPEELPEQVERLKFITIK